MSRYTQSKTSEPVDYSLLCQQLDALIEDESNLVANLANAAALLWMSLERINWAGFYLLEGDILVLGPFQGKPACTRIAVGQGVCGTAVALRQPMLVADVHAFPGHIACDSASNSEVVIPLIDADGKIWGVLDIDSPEFERFDDDDENGLSRFANHLLAAFNK